MKRSFSFTLAIPAMICFAAWAYWWAPHDDTDPPGERSGLQPYTDHLTGCQYLKAGSLFGGALTPRMGTNGKQICVRRSTDTKTAAPLQGGE